jgi:hypothetical protein
MPASHIHMVSCMRISCTISDCAPRVAQVLNAKPENVDRESEIVAQAGRAFAITIATNMAGMYACMYVCVCVCRLIKFAVDGASFFALDR